MYRIYMENKKSIWIQGYIEWCQEGILWQRDESLFISDRISA